MAVDPRTASNYLQPAPTPNSLADVVDLMLDKIGNAFPCHIGADPTSGSDRRSRGSRSAGRS